MIGIYRRCKRIHLILDNYVIHKSKKVMTFLAHAGAKIRLHFLPAYSPNENNIECLWKQMHDHVTRNHKHADVDLLLKDVYFFLDNIQPFCKTKFLRFE